jgi:hypothetical protein
MANNLETGKNRGAKEGGGADLALLCPPRTAVTLDTSMGTEAEAIQSSPRFFLISRAGMLWTIEVECVSFLCGRPRQ